MLRLAPATASCTTTLPGHRLKFFQATPAQPHVEVTVSDISNPCLLYLKGFLFLVAGSISAGILLHKHPSLETAALLGVSIWSFSRAYYFVFYVIQHYVDDTFRFSGVTAFVCYLLRRNR